MLGELSKVKIFDRFKNNILPAEFSADNLLVEWLAGNKLRITYLSTCYVNSGDTLTVVAPIKFEGITPGQVYPEVK